MDGSEDREEINYTPRNNYQNEIGSGFHHQPSIGLYDNESKRDAKIYKLAWYPPTEPSVKNIESAEGSSTTLVDKRAYIIGGLASTKSPINFCYDIEEDKYLNLQTTGIGPSSISYHSAICVNGKIYVFGGDVQVGSSNTKMTSNEIWSLDLETKEWQKLKPLKFIEPRKYHAACEFGKYVLVSGGIGEEATAPFKDFHAFESGIVG